MAAVLRTWKNLWHLEARRGLTLVVLVAFCATLLPLPMLSPAQSAKYAEEAFPCQDSPCGCRTAHQCWTSCCCTTPAERLAWARSHGVTPPAYARQALHKLAAAAAAIETAEAPKTKSCCAKKSTCCVDKAGPSPQRAGVTKPRLRRVVIGSLALQCQGKASAYTSIPWAITASSARLPMAVLPIESGWQLDDLRPVSVTHVPPLPPPRRFL
jgi:hypothetical protein